MGGSCPKEDLITTRFRLQGGVFLQFREQFFRRGFLQFLQISTVSESRSGILSCMKYPFGNVAALQAGQAACPRRGQRPLTLSDILSGRVF